MKSRELTVAPNLTGLDDFIKQLDFTYEMLVNAGCLGLFELGHKVIRKSQEMVPVDTGALFNSAFVDMPRVDRHLLLVRIGYGGANAQTNPKTGKSSDFYAVDVHENFRMRHAHGRKAKFLEIPYLWVARSRMVPFMAEHLSVVFLGAPPRWLQGPTSQSMRFWLRRGGREFALPKRNSSRIPKEVSSAFKELQKNRRDW
jgi:hypothetical protein